MGTARITVTMPEDLARRLREEVAAGRAASVSSLVGQAVSRRLRSAQLDDVLTELRTRLGPPTQEDREWVRQVLGR